MEDLDRYSYNPSSAGLQLLLMLETGVRIGEACGLKWSDVEGDWLQIQRQANNERVIPHPKTEKGNRRIPLTEQANAARNALSLAGRASYQSVPNSKEKSPDK